MFCFAFVEHRDRWPSQNVDMELQITSRRLFFSFNALTMRSGLIRRGWIHILRFITRFIQADERDGRCSLPARGGFCTRLAFLIARSSVAPHLNSEGWGIFRLAVKVRIRNPCSHSTSLCFLYNLILSTNPTDYYYYSILGNDLLFGVF